MTDGTLIAIPLPILSALLCAVISVLVLRLDLGSTRTPKILSVLFGILALESLLVALRFGYGVESFVALQRILPLLVGPLLYLAFSSLAVAPDQFARLMFVHLGAVVIIAIGFQLLSPWLGPLDWVISASYLFYAVALLLMWRKGPDHLIQAHLNVARGVGHCMLWSVGFLMLLLVLDSAIAVSFAMQDGGRALTLISYGSILLLPLLMLLFVFLPKALANRPQRPRPSATDDADTARLEAAARELLTSTQLYLDPDLSVERLAKRLHVPVRSLSFAINDSQGMNVSQYVNGFRLAHAADLLRESDDSVAKVMAQSGFLTRSNFYREFQRVHGQSPAAYRQSNSTSGA